MLFIFGNFQSGFSDGETASFPGIWLCFTLLSQEFWSTWPAVWWPHALHFDTGSDRTQSPSWMLPWISKSSGNKQNLLSTRRTGHCIVSSTDKGHQKRYFITTASGDLYLKKKKKVLNTIHRGHRDPIKCGNSLWFVSDSHKRRALLSHQVDLSSCFRDEKTEAGRENRSELSDWWVAEAPGALPPLIFLADRVAYISSTNVFSPSLNRSEPRQSTLGKAFWGSANQHPPRKGELPAPSWSS